MAVAAFPDVFWLPAVLTPGRLIFAVPLNDTPPIGVICTSTLDVSGVEIYKYCLRLKNEN